MTTIKFLNGIERMFASLRGANLVGANLRDANLGCADLVGADLGGANLRGADLRDANLVGANLRDANLGGANLRGADLGGANLRGADLRDANLVGANLRDADLRDANLVGANLDGAIGLEQHNIVAQGMLVGYKKLRGGTIATLIIPAAARRVNAYGSRKCRAEWVEVSSGNGAARFDFTQYIQGEIVRPDSFDPDPRVECSHGIHFFITEQEAKDY